MTWLDAVGAALGLGSAQFVASFGHKDVHLNETSATRLATDGAALREPWFRELLARGDRVRMIVGDDFHTTDPTALARWLDLDAAEISLIQTDGLSFHPKSWLFNIADAHGGVVGELAFEAFPPSPPRLRPRA